MDNGNENNGMTKRMLKHLGRRVRKNIGTIVVLAMLPVLVFGGSVAYNYYTSPTVAQHDAAEGAADMECMNVIRMGGSCELIQRNNIQHPDGSLSAIFVAKVTYGDMPTIFGVMVVEVDKEGLVWAIH
jgi:hypothetical protein